MLLTAMELKTSLLKVYLNLMKLWYVSIVGHHVLVSHLLIFTHCYVFFFNIASTYLEIVRRCAIMSSFLLAHIVMHFCLSFRLSTRVLHLVKVARCIMYHQTFSPLDMPTILVFCFQISLQNCDKIALKTTFLIFD